MIFAGIEAGGTKFVCGIGNSEGEILDHTQIPTTRPEETISRVIEYFDTARKKFDWQRIGLASFGPLDLNPNSQTYGYITSTPKPGWRDFDLRGALVRGLGPMSTVRGLPSINGGSPKGKARSFTSRSAPASAAA